MLQKTNGNETKHKTNERRNKMLRLSLQKKKNAGVQLEHSYRNILLHIKATKRSIFSRGWGHRTEPKKTFFSEVLRNEAAKPINSNKMKRITGKDESAAETG